jgi:hypothetical protein
MVYEIGQAGEGVALEQSASSYRLITEKMIEAGVYAAKEHPLGADLRDLVWSVFLAMDSERQNNDLASSINEIR